MKKKKGSEKNHNEYRKHATIFPEDQHNDITRFGYVHILGAMRCALRLQIHHRYKNTKRDKAL